MIDNEIQFLRWPAFQQMAPAIVRLEISRLADVTTPVGRHPGLYNMLVKARYELKRFLRCLEQNERQSLEEDGAHHLRKALLLVALARSEADKETRETLNYTADRLCNLSERMEYLY